MVSEYYLILFRADNPVHEPNWPGMTRLSTSELPLAQRLRVHLASHERLYFLRCSGAQGGDVPVKHDDKRDEGQEVCEE